MPSWYLTLQNDFYAMKYYDWLKNLCQRWGLDKYDNLHNHLLCGQPNIESLEPIRSLLRICMLIHTQSSYRQLFNIKDNLLIWQKLSTKQEYKIIYKALQDHIAAYGDRGVEELKLETQTFREKPEDLIRLTKYYNQLGIAVEELGQKEQEICQNAEYFIKKKLKNIFKKWVFTLVLRQTRQAVANRENMRFARSRLYGIVRRLFYRMACLFVEKGVLNSVSDIYYLTIDELFGYITGKAETQNLQALVEIRKAEYAQFAKQNLEERIQTDGLPYLNSWQTSQATMDQNKVLKGIGCSAGNVIGMAKIIYHPETPIADPNHILVTRSTDPGWVFLMLASKGIIVERGSVLSHTAIIGRELGIPTIVGAKSATRLIPDQIPVTMNGSTGVVTWQ
jgi:pyruvate,water dikinase